VCCACHCFHLNTLQGLGFKDSIPTPKLQAALQLKPGIVTSGVSWGVQVATVLACRCSGGCAQQGPPATIVHCCVTPRPTGNSLDYTDKCMAIMSKHGAAVKEMEAAAIAWVAQLFAKPMFCIKAVTDIVDGDRATQEEFLENLSAAAGALQRTLPRVLEFISGKTLAEL
jgi:hypothetical protein